MATTGQWEVVGKTSKKTKVQNNNLNKTQKKNFIDQMPRIEASDPVQESTTIYDAFLEKEKRASNHEGSNNKKANHEAVPQKKNPQSKKKSVPSKNGPVSLEEALGKLHKSELETILSKDQLTFPENPSVWLKDMASYINLKLDDIPENDPVFEGKPNNFPSCLLLSPVKKLLMDTFKKCHRQTLDLFFDHCIQSMVSEQSKGLSTYGYRIFIQLLISTMPDIAVSSIPKVLDRLKNNQNRPLRCLSVMWAVGQAGLKDLRSGLRVWLEIMLPVLNMRALSAYAISYLEILFSTHDNLKSAYDVISFRDFFPILDVVFATNSNLPTNLQKKLQVLYPKLKTVAFGKEPGTSLRNFFPSFLARATTNCHKNLKAELLSCLVTCLSVDKCCFSTWRQMYVKHIQQSSVLLKHLVDTWDESSKKIERKLLKETISAFSITNEELMSQGKANVDGYQTCVASCKELLQRLNSMPFPWRLLVFTFLSLITGLVAYDVYSSKGFHKSKTSRLLHDTGVLAFAEQVWLRIVLYAGKAWAWMETNVPHYYAKACEFSGPYFVLFWEKMCDFGIFVAESTKPQRDWLNQKIPEGLEWVQSKVPGLFENVLHYVSIAWDLLVQYSLWLWEHFVYLCHVTGTWLTENVFVGSWSIENLHKLLASSLAYIQKHSSSMIEWCSNMWHSKSS